MKRYLAPEVLSPVPWLLVALFILLWPILSGRAVPVWDSFAASAPCFSLVADHARSARLLLWSPVTDGGVPLFAEPQTGALSPVTYLLGFIFGGGKGYAFYWVLIWVAGTLGFYRFFIDWGTPPLAAFGLALSYLGNGVYLGNAGHSTWIISISFFPWILLWLNRSLRPEGNWREAALAGLLWGLSALSGGYPGYTIASLMFFGVWIAFEIVRGRTSSEVPPPAKLVKRGFLACAVGSLLVLPAYWIFWYECAGFTDRVASLSREMAVEINALHPSAWKTLWSHYLSIYSHGRWRITDVTSLSLYVGILPLCLAVASLFISPRRSNLSLAGLAVFFFAVACGRAFPVRGWLYDLLPITRYFRHANLFRYFAIFVLYLLAARAARELMTSRRSAKITALVITCLAAAFAFPVWNSELALSAGSLVRSENVATARLALIAGFGFAILGQILLLALPRRQAIGWAVLLVGCFLDTMLTMRSSSGVYADQSAQGIAAWDRYERIHVPSLNHLDGKGEKTEGWGNESLLDKKRAIYSYTPLTNRYYHDLLKLKTFHAFNRGPFRVLFALRDAVPKNSRGPESFDRFVANAKSAATPPIVLHNRSTMLSSSAGPIADERPALGTYLDVSDVDIGWNHIRFTVKAPAAGWIVLPERWARSWTATIDGTELHPWGADFVYMALPVEPKVQRISLEYRPSLSLAALAFSWLSLAVVGFLCLPCFFKRAER